MGSSSFFKCNNDINTISKKTTIIIDEKEYIWIDPEIENEENKTHYDDLFTKENIVCAKFNNIDESYNYLTQKGKNYKEIIIIISGRLFNGFYYKLKKNINSIKFSPTIIVFTSKKIYL